MGAAHFMAQNALLLVVFLLSAVAPSLAVYSSGECTFNTKGTCEYQGQVYGIGDSWVTKDCYHCVCMEPFGVGCCDQGSGIIRQPFLVTSPVELVCLRVIDISYRAKDWKLTAESRQSCEPAYRMDTKTPPDIS
ncbi:hypothetical protein SRHO_G00052970 [Serrasalmus rhombeus]